MTTTYKVLGQNTPTANTVTTLYTVPANTSAVVSTVTICNQSGSNSTVGIAVCPANTTVTTSQYIVNSAVITVADTIFLTVGVTLAATDTIRVVSTTANVSFNAFGSEIS